MNLAEIREAVERRCGIAYDTDALTEVINEALATISTERDWPWLDGSWTFNELEGQRTYKPPWSWRKVISVTRNGRLIPMVPITVLDDSEYEIGWAVDGDRLVLGPTPSATGAIVARLVREEQRLSAPASTPLLPAEWHSQVLVNLAASIVHERLEQFERADRCVARYEDARQRMISGANRVKGPHRVRVRPGSML